MTSRETTPSSTAETSRATNPYVAWPLGIGAPLLLIGVALALAAVGSGRPEDWTMAGVVTWSGIALVAFGALIAGVDWTVTNRR
jgi:peptidoglycan/LPS O-acetylase OafA/YrhL